MYPYQQQNSYNTPPPSYPQQQQPGGNYPYQQPPAYPPPGANPYGTYPPPPGGNPYGNAPPPPPPGYPAPPQGGQGPYGQQQPPYGGYGQQQQPPYGGYAQQQSPYGSSSSSFGQPLNMTINSANNLTEVEKFGKQDPYVQFSTNYQDAQSFQKTAVANNAGQSAAWNQSFTLPAGAQTLYLEVMDKERTGFDEVIGFAAIPLQQASMGLNAVFEIYSTNGKSAGEVHLTFGQSMQPGVSRGQSYVDEGHAKRVKSLKSKATASDVAVGGAVALGVGLLAKHFYNEREDHGRRE